MSKFVPAEAAISIRGGPVIPDDGSGFLTDETCFRIKAQSNFNLEGTTFAAVDLVFDTSHMIINSTNRSRRSDTNDKNYSPVAGSLLAIETINASNVPVLALEDTVPPSFGTTCPSKVTIPSIGTEVAADWDEPIATDNVEVISVTSTVSPGDILSFFNSPIEVRYTARDSSDLLTVCLFEVEIEVNTTTFILETTMSYSSNPDERFVFTKSGAVGAIPERVENQLVPSLPALVVDLSQYNQLIFEFNVARDGDNVLVRSTEAGEYGLLSFNIQYLDDSKSVMPFLVPDDDVKVYVDIDGIQLDANSMDVNYLTERMFIRNAFVALDPDSGAIKVDAKTRSFTRGFSFTGLKLTVEYPASRKADSPTVYAPVEGSGVFVEIYAASTTAPSEAELKGRPRVLLLDEVPPSVDSCDSDYVINITSNVGTVAVSWNEPLFSDARGVVSRDGPNATTADFGLLLPNEPADEVVYSARDLFGNEAECRFSVILNDEFEPNADFVRKLSRSLPANDSKIVVPPADWLPKNMRDNSGYDVTVVSPDPTQSLDITIPGADFTVTIMDVYGNTKSRVLSIDVVDNTPPVVRCPTLNPVVTPEDSNVAVVDWDLREPIDNYAPPNYTLTHASGDQFPVGETVVTLTAIDASGNNASCNFKVIVEQRLTAASGDNAQADSNVIMGAGTGAGVLFLFVVILVVLLLRARARSKVPQDWNDIFALIDQFKGKDSGEIVEPRELLRGQVNLLEELGKGAFGVVYKGLMSEGGAIPDYLVAVKSLHPSSSVSDRTELLEEAAVMAQFNHRNVVSLVGVVTVGKPLMVVLEYLEYGSLQSYVKKNNVPEETKLMFAGDIAAGLHHVNEKGFVHRDVAARNVLVSSLKRCKIADFGMARDTSEDVEGGASYYRSRGGQLPVRWSAPEALEDRKFTEKSDVWSYGVTLHELWNKAAMPYEGWHNQKVWVEICGGHRLAKPDDCDDDVYKIMLDCWNAEAEPRPTFKELAATFRSLYFELTGEPVDDDTGYMDLGSDTSETKSQTLVSRLFRRVSRQLSPRSSQQSGQSGSRSRGRSEDANTNEPLDEKDEHAAMYDMGGDEPAPQAESRPSNDAMELYDMGDDEPEAQASGVRDEDAALYDMGNDDDEVPIEDNMPKNNGEWNADVYDMEDAATAIGSVEVEEEMGFGDEPTVAETGDVGSKVETVAPAGFGDDVYGNVDVGAKAPEVEKAAVPDQSWIGRRCKVMGYDAEGTVRFVGKHVIKQNDRVGVELDGPCGRNNGTVKGHAYFVCKPLHGVLVVPHKVELLD
eukprot:TRINITY_DN11783_c0_g1_i1.p1 TRINITY_DN11783_c0_g1~~TRINITY_DN11783_c0_g1_i1.p1  ORF type:complete len:1320 (+),score=353.99 TRINITY_DN11783_c0_g1_i1:92-3961(+)